MPFADADSVGSNDLQSDSFAEHDSLIPKTKNEEADKNAGIQLPQKQPVYTDCNDSIRLAA